MNYLLVDDDTGPGNTVEFVQAQVHGRPAVCGVLACYPLSEVETEDFYRDRMRRALDAGR